MNTVNQLSILAVSYISLFLLCYFVWKMKSENLLSRKVQNGNWILLHVRHAGGIAIIVFIPMFFLPGIQQGLLTWPQNIGHIQVMVFMVTGLALLIFSAKAVDKIENKIIVAHRWSSTQAVVHMVLRNSFLICYEWFFRGLVLFSCIAAFGIIPAVLINLILYALIHAFNGKKQLLGTIPFGIILCAFTIWWHSVWPAVLLHMLLSSTFESALLHPFFCKPSKIKL